MELTQEQSLREITLSGSPYERGFQHGSQLREEICGFVADNLAQVNLLRAQPIGGSALPGLMLPYKKMLATWMPDLLEEVRGIAAGSGISEDEAILLQTRREVIGVGGFTLNGDCSSFAVHRKDGRVMAQTIDLNGDMTALGQVFRIKPPHAKGPEILMYSFAGLLAYMGMNSYGLSVAINLVVTNGWKPGIPAYLLVRKFLECQSIEECLHIADTLPRASSRSFIIADNQRQVAIELTPTEYRVTEKDFLGHTNHFLHPELKASDRMNIFSKNSSVKRLALLRELLGDSPLQKNHIQQVFADHTLYPVGTCAHNMGNMKLNETVAAVIMYPAEGSFWALKGKACEGTYQHFKL